MTATAENFNQLLTQTPSDFQRAGTAGRPAGAGPAIASNWVTGYGFAGNPVTSYGVAGTWGTGYGVAGVPVAGNVLLITGSPFMLEILINTLLCYMFLQINMQILYISVKLPYIQRSLQIIQ
jgi:hypothetical protein